jgi:hypothetical protein
MREIHNGNVFVEVQKTMSTIKCGILWLFPSEKYQKFEFYYFLTSYKCMTLKSTSLNQKPCPATGNNQYLLY